MSEQIKIAFVSFGRGMASFIRPWRPVVVNNQERSDRSRGVGVYFARVGERLGKATARYAEAHPEIPAYA